MKKQILISVILIGSIFTMHAQIYTPSSIIQGPSGNNNVGIGTATPAQNFHVVGNGMYGNGQIIQNGNALLKKVEELTLYLIEQNKLLVEQGNKMKLLEGKINK